MGVTRRAFAGGAGMAVVVALGCGLRLLHYLRQPSVWHDEAALLVNVLEKGFGDLLGPLIYSEAAPPVFLWIERAMALVVGDGVQSLRFVPFAAGCATLFFLAFLARRFLAAPAAIATVLLVACSDRLLWHSCEAKPYALDALVACGMLAAYVHWRERSWFARLAVLSMPAPLVIWLSYPGCFVCGGLMLALVFEVRGERRHGPWIGVAIFSALVSGSFLILVKGPAHAQHSETLLSCWVNYFPPYHQIWRVPVWAVAASFDAVRYCFGPTGFGIAVLAIHGARQFWNRGERAFVVAGCAPAGLALAASFLHAYPWGGARVEVFLAPAIALFAGEGLLAAWRSIRPIWRPALAVLFMVPCALASGSAVVDWRRSDCDRATNLVLNHWRPGDAITGNCWECRYYFRHVADRTIPIEMANGCSQRRLWMVIADLSPHPLQPLGSVLRGCDWEILGKRTYRDSFVYLLRRRDSAHHVAANDVRAE